MECSIGNTSCPKLPQPPPARLVWGWGRGAVGPGRHFRILATWNPDEVFAPMVALMLPHPPNLWNEFGDGSGPQNSVFLNEHPVVSDLKNAMRDDVERMLFLLYDKAQGYPGMGVYP